MVVLAHIGKHAVHELIIDVLVVNTVDGEPGDVGVLGGEAIGSLRDGMLQGVALITVFAGTDVDRLVGTALLGEAVPVGDLHALGVGLHAHKELLLLERVGDVLERTGLKQVAEALVGAVLAGELPLSGWPGLDLLGVSVGPQMDVGHLGPPIGLDGRSKFADVNLLAPRSLGFRVEVDPDTVVRLGRIGHGAHRQDRRDEHERSHLFPVLNFNNSEIKINEVNFIVENWICDFIDDIFAEYILNCDVKY